MDFAWPKRPYKGLAKYSVEDAALFVGREEEVRRCGERLEDSELQLFILHGLSGTGKSSFLQAGLLPYLANAPGSRLSLTGSAGSAGRRGIVIRAGGAPLKAIARRVWDLTEAALQGGAASEETTVKLHGVRLGKMTAEEFVEKAGSSAEEMLRAIERLTRATRDRLLLVVDQAEEVFLSGAEGALDREEFFAFLLKVCSHRFDMKLLIGMRSDFKAKFDEELSAREVDPTTVGSYYLNPIGERGILKAILRPTLCKHRAGDAGAKGDRPHYRFDFEKGLPELMVQDLVRNTEPSSWLPVLQVICDRLYTQLKPKGKRQITFEAYRAAGACNAQVASHIEDRIVTFLSQKSAPVEGQISLGKEADLWKSVLWECAHVQSDGRVTAKPAMANETLLEIARAETDGRIDHAGMLEWLALEENYILERVPTPPPGQGYGWRLLHDSIAAALVQWRNAEGALRNAAIVDSDPMLDTAAPGYVEPITSEPVTFSTINDLIWDHQIALYAQAKGFSQRLGFAFEIEKKFDLTKVKGEMDYAKFVSRRKSDRKRLIVMPSFMMRAMQKQPWTIIGITNLYRGYAILGQPMKGLTPVRGPHDNKTPPSHNSRRERLHRLAEALSHAKKRIGVFEERSEEFVNFILRSNHFAPRTNFDRLGVDGDGKPKTSTRDLLFSALVKGDLDFGLGPAPSRALAEQAGFVVYADFEDVYELATHEEKEELKKLLMHEVWAVDVAGNDEATLLRLAALMFYTVDFIRRNPEDFISFVHDQMLLALNDGAYWLQRKFIRAAVESCYSYVASIDYAFRYGTRNPLGREEDDAMALHGRWTHLRGQCDGLIAQLARVPWKHWPTEAREAFSRGERQYRIYNYYDAHRELLSAREAVGPS